MFALAVAAATVSLLGSPHCAGMCGPFVLLAADTRRPGFSAVVYHLGRLSTYLLLGLAAGLAGLAVDAGARAVAIQQAAATLAGVTMVGFGVVALVRRFIPSLPGGHTAPPAFVQRWVQAGYRGSGRMGDASRPFAIGALTTLLPCGWLYMFVIAAAGTASVAGGVVVMAAFWVGTVPVLAGFSVGVRSLGESARTVLPVATACLAIAAGWQLLTLRAYADFSSLRSAIAVGPEADAVVGVDGLCLPPHLAVGPLPCCEAPSTDGGVTTETR